ncbi:MAG: (Fe-S)-binding protein [Eubacteriaceae bacterium]
MYLENIRLVYIKPCTTGEGRIKFRAKLDHPIFDLLPYLNAEIKTALYIPRANTFSYKINNHIITINGERLTVTQLTSESECYEMIDFLKDLINTTWEKRHEITPFYETRERPNAMTLYKLLPKTNCKDCGQSTCMAFATKLMMGTTRLNQCLILKEVQYQTQFESLEGYLQLLGYETE